MAHLGVALILILLFGSLTALLTDFLDFCWLSLSGSGKTSYLNIF